MRKWILILVALTALIAVFFVVASSDGAAAQEKPQEAAPPAVTVEVATAREIGMESVLWVPGTVVSRGDVRLSAETTGRLIWVAEVGDAVGEGDVVARIDDRREKLQVEHDQATIERLEAQLRYLDLEVRRLRTLSDEQITARRQLDEILSRQEMAEQDLVLAQVELKQTLDRLERSEVRSPFPGKVVERYRSAGSYVSPGGEVVRLVDTTHTEVSVQAPLSVAPFLTDGMEVELRDEATALTSRVRAAIPVGDERSRMFEVRVELPPGSKSPWVVGAAVRCALPQNARGPVVAVPRDALILRHDETYVLKVTADGTVERVVVKTGSAEGPMIEVRGGVAAGDRLVVRGGERLQPGQAVVVRGEG